MKKILISMVLVLAVALIIFKERRISSGQESIKAETVVISGKFDQQKYKSDEEWKNTLTPEQYYILRDAGTERPFSGELNEEKRAGTYYSVGCDLPLFRSEQKYDSGTGWPSFWAPINESGLVLRKENKLGDDRIEVLDTCGNHLGHVFDDGPKPTGKRYCMNAVALRFIPDKESK